MSRWLYHETLLKRTRLFFGRSGVNLASLIEPNRLPLVLTTVQRQKDYKNNFFCFFFHYRVDMLFAKTVAQCMFYIYLYICSGTFRNRLSDTFFHLKIHFLIWKFVNKNIICTQGFLLICDTKNFLELNKVRKIGKLTSLFRKSKFGTLIKKKQ
jgi:hypothetical protein